MKTEAVLILIDQSLKLYRKGKLDEEDCLSSIRAALGVPEREPQRIIEGTDGYLLKFEPPIKFEGLPDLVKPNAPFDIDNPDPAMMAMCGPLLRDYKRGAVSRAPDSDAREIVMEQVMRRDVDIRAERQRLIDLASAPKPVCADCGAPGVWKVHGIDYCAKHSADHREGAPPSLTVVEGGVA